MNTTLTLVDLGGAIALLIWGVHMVQTGITRAFGPQLRRMLSYALGNRFKAFLAGVGVTSILQSSTATGLMVTAFAAGGLVDLVPALAVMLGANVGTTLIVQVLSFDVSRVSFLFILIGVFMFRRSGVTRTRDLGRVGIGLGLMLIALQHLLSMITPYEDVPSLRMLLGAVTTDPLDRHSARGRIDVGGAFERRRRVVDHGLCGPSGRAAARGVRARARGQPRHGSEPAARKRCRRRPRRQTPADRQSDQPDRRLRAGARPSQLDRPGAHHDRAGCRARRRRFSHRLQHCPGAAVLPVC